MENMSPSGRTVLIAEDSVAQRRFLEILLSEDGYNVVTFENGFDALQYLEENTPDLIIMDVNMPYINGLEVSENIKNQENLQHIPIILMSSFEEDISEEMFNDSQANIFLKKPIISKEFRELASGFLKNSLQTALI